jgi:hypothetical protein
MRNFVIGAWLAAATVASMPAISRCVRPATSELSLLRSLDTGDLARLRAGAADGVDPLDDSDRASLAQSERANPNLAALRAGDLSNSTLITIALVLAIIVLVVILI